MCYKAGPRCPSVALLAIEKAENKWNHASSITERNDAMQEIMEAKHQYDLTVKGQKDIESLIQTAKLQNDVKEVTRLNTRLDNARKERKELLEKSGIKDSNKDPKHSYSIPTSKENPSVRTARLLEMVKAETNNLKTSEGWEAHLTTISKFPQVSFENQILLEAQNPDSSNINTYEDWNKHGRAVNHNSQAIWLLTPTVTKTQEVNRETGETRITEKIIGHRSVGTFDIGDTVGKKQPTVKPEYDSYNTHLRAKLKVYGYEVKVAQPENIDGRKALTDIKNKTVYVSSLNTPEENSASLISQVSHIGLGHDKSKTTNQREVSKRLIESQSLEYSLRKNIGLENKTDFSHIEEWAKYNDIAGSAERVSKASRFLLRK